MSHKILDKEFVSILMTDILLWFKLTTRIVFNENVLWNETKYNNYKIKQSKLPSFTD